MIADFHSEWTTDVDSDGFIEAASGAAKMEHPQKENHAGMLSRPVGVW